MADSFKPYCEVPECYAETYVHFEYSHMCRHHALVNMVADLTAEAIVTIFQEAGRTDVLRPAQKSVEAYQIACGYCGSVYNLSKSQSALWPPEKCTKCGQFKIELRAFT